MSARMPAQQVLDREYLEIRAKILELAASFDRLDRSDGSVTADPRWSLIHEGIDVLKRKEDGRAEQVQMIFSRQYSSQWRQQMSL